MNHNMQSIRELVEAVDKRTGLSFGTTYFMDGTVDLKINGTWVFAPDNKEPSVNHKLQSGGAKNLEEIAAFLNGILFGMDY